MPAALLVAWAKVKKYWYVVVAVVGAILAAVLFLDRPDDHTAKRLDEINKTHDEEIKKIQAANHDERKQVQNNAEKLERTLTAIQDQYAAQGKSLDDDKKREIAALVQQHGDDEAAMLAHLAEATGFPVALNK